jgi:hypothetical protein
MSTLSDLKQAVRDGDDDLVEDLAEELSDDGIDITPALKLAENINRAKPTRGQWGRIVRILKEYC